jgi:two-component system OmpR family sensor kinase
MTRTKGGAPLFVQALGLVILTLVAAQVIAIAVIFTLPPPPPEFYRMSEITRALKTGETVQTRDGRALVIKKRPSMRSGGPDSARRLAFKAGIGRAIDVAPARIEIVTNNDGPRFFVRRLKQNEVPKQAGRNDDANGSREGQAVLVVPEALAVPEISSSPANCLRPAIAAPARPRPTSP